MKLKLTEMSFEEAKAIINEEIIDEIHLNFSVEKRYGVEFIDAENGIVNVDSEGDEEDIQRELSALQVVANHVGTELTYLDIVHLCDAEIVPFVALDSNYPDQLAIADQLGKYTGFDNSFMIFPRDEAYERAASND